MIKETYWNEDTKIFSEGLFYRTTIIERFLFDKNNIKYIPDLITQAIEISEKYQLIEDKLEIGNVNMFLNGCLVKEWLNDICKSKNNKSLKDHYLNYYQKNTIIFKMGELEFNYLFNESFVIEVTGSRKHDRISVNFWNRQE